MTSADCLHARALANAAACRTANNASAKARTA